MGGDGGDGAGEGEGAGDGVGVEEADDEDEEDDDITGRIFCLRGDFGRAWIACQKNFWRWEGRVWDFAKWIGFLLGRKRSVLLSGEGNCWFALWGRFFIVGMWIG